MGKKIRTIMLKRQIFKIAETHCGNQKKYWKWYRIEKNMANPNNFATLLSNKVQTKRD